MSERRPTRRTRPWGPLKGATPQQNKAAEMLRTWLDQADLTISALHAVLAKGRGPVQSRATVSDRLAGLNLTEDFVDAVANACFPADEAPHRARQGRRVLGGGEPAMVGTSGTPPVVAPRSGPTGNGRVADPRPDPRLPADHAQLRLNVVELGRRLSASIKDTAALTEERNTLRTKCGALERALSASESTVRALKERLAADVEGPAKVRTACHAAVHGLASVPPCREAGGRPEPGSASGYRLQEPGAKPASVMPPALPVEVPPGASAAQPVRSAAPRAAAVPVPEALIPAFEVFRTYNAARYTTYARLHLPRDRADAAVKATFDVLLEVWTDFLGHPEPAALAWQLLRRQVGKQARAVSDMHQVRHALRDARTSLGAMTSTTGLFTAIAELPERQFDVIVLHYMMGYSHSEVAQLMGLGEHFVRSSVRHAKGHLARSLALRDADALPLW
ncbi:sigma-70 family RNA polymerase sigma factor [Streptomyces sp. NPDC006798]|uniref:RNA polymerase sigma factor n=1 Tax=Streptomyces sp. NPDC006798 TaxID=3155462 RepID=UPI0033F6FCD4